MNRTTSDPLFFDLFLSRASTGRVPAHDDRHRWHESGQPPHRRRHENRLCPARQTRVALKSPTATNRLLVFSKRSVPTLEPRDPVAIPYRPMIQNDGSRFGRQRRNFSSPFFNSSKLLAHRYPFNRKPLCFVIFRNKMAPWADGIELFGAS